RKLTDLPRLFSEARNLIVPTGKCRSSSTLRIRSPTTPVAPTTATLGITLEYLAGKQTRHTKPRAGSLSEYQSKWCWKSGEIEGPEQKARKAVRGRLGTALALVNSSRRAEAASGAGRRGRIARRRLRGRGCRRGRCGRVVRVDGRRADRRRSFTFLETFQS